jgi:hypothetical protein
MSEPIRIIDIIAKPYMIGSDHIVYYAVLDRMPEMVYERNGKSFVSQDSGFYDFLEGKPGNGQAFAGRVFSIKLTDGSTFLCEGQVWSCAPPTGTEPTVGIGVATRESLAECYVFSSASVARSALNAWLANNTPSNNYYKYDERESVAWLDQHRASGARQVCANRARKLRRRGVTVWRDDEGARVWNPWYERRKSDLANRLDADPGSIR